MAQTTTNKSFLHKIAGMGVKDDMSDSQQRSILMNNLLSQNDGMAYFILIWVFWLGVDSPIGAIVTLTLFLLKMGAVGLSAAGKTLTSKVLSIYALSLLGGPLLWAGLNSTEHFYSVNVYYSTMLIYSALSFDWEKPLEKRLSIVACALFLLGFLTFSWLDQYLTFSNSTLVLDDTIISTVFPIFGCVLAFSAFAMLQNANAEASKELKSSMITVKIQHEELLASEEELRQNAEELLATNQMLEAQKVQLEDAQEQSKISREELQKTKERFELAIAGSSDGIWDWDIITNEIYYSLRWKAMLGYADEEIENTFDTFNALMHPDDGDRVTALIGEYFSTDRQSHEVEFRLKQKDGTYRWILGRGIVSRNEKGEPYRLTGSHTDIQANKEQAGIIKAKNEELLASEEELRQNLEELQTTQEALRERNQEIASKEKQIRQIFDGVPAMIYQFVFSPTGEMSVPIASKGAIAIYGIPAEEIMEDARKIIDIVHPDDMANFEESIMVSAQTLTIWNEQVRIKTNDDYKWVEGTAMPEKLEDGSIIWSGMVMDITERKEIEIEVLQKTEALQSSEEELRQNLEELQTTQEQVLAEKHKAEEALQALKETQNQLVQAEKMSSLGQLTAGVAHEINNPVNFISGGSQTLKIIMEDLFEFFDCYHRLEKAENSEEKALIWEEIKAKKQDLGTQEELKEDAEALMMDIEKGVGRVVEIVNGLRNFSRSDSADMALADLHESLDAALLILRNKHKDRVDIARDYDESLPAIQCYAGQLSQVFMNVIGNAIDAIPEKGEVKISTKNLKELVQIKIIDTGTGIPEGIRKEVFNPFFTTKPVGKGTGLGLSISHGIIEKHQGTMEVQSVEGEGTTFIIKIPKHIIK